MLNPVEIALMVGAGVLLFGAERLPKLARSAGEMRREFMRGQVEGEGSTPGEPAAPGETPTTPSGAPPAGAHATDPFEADRSTRPR